MESSKEGKKNRQRNRASKQVYGHRTRRNGSAAERVRRNGLYESDAREG